MPWVKLWLVVLLSGPHTIASRVIAESPSEVEMSKLMSLKLEGGHQVFL